MVRIYLMSEFSHLDPGEFGGDYDLLLKIKVSFLPSNCTKSITHLMLMNKDTSAEQKV